MKTGSEGRICLGPILNYLRSLYVYIYAKTYTKHKRFDRLVEEARNNEQYDLSLQV